MIDTRWSVQTVAWNDPRYFFDLMHSLEQQVGTQAHALLIEHARQGVLSSQEMDSRHCTILRNASDKGFGLSHEQAMRFVVSHWPPEELHQRYLAVVHPDVLFEPHCLFQVECWFATHPDVSLVLPRALSARLDFSETGEQRSVVFGEALDTQEPACVFIRASSALELPWNKATDVSTLIRRYQPSVCSEAMIWHHTHPLSDSPFFAKVRGLW
ncbi:hypothetical protein FJZ48_03405, partial [Candidatus Uhrbacteria bacterium]|nr:hypothetical protein [Candidatus Uhrbacteria bacterium]